MAVLFMDGFEQSWDILQKWDDFDGLVTLGSSDGEYGRRVSSRGVKLYGEDTYLQKILTSNHTTLIVGYALYINHYPETCKINLVEFHNDVNGDKHLYFQLERGTVDLVLGNVVSLYTLAGDLLGTSSILIPSNQWCYLEFKVNFSLTTGSYDFRVNKQSVLSDTNVCTVFSNNNAYSSVVYIANYADYDNKDLTNDLYIDDLYISNSSGSKNTTFLGNVRIDAIVPTSNGNYSNWDASDGANYECVDELPNENSDYVTASTLNDRDSYIFSNLPSEIIETGIHAIQINTPAFRNELSIESSIKHFCRLSNTNYTFSTEFDLLTEGDYIANNNQIIEISPVTSEKWTMTEINNAEFGIQLTSIV